MIKTVIVEDDLMVASINNQFAKKIPEVKIVATFHDGKDALSFLSKNKVDLLLLDLYIPSFSGLELLSELRRLGNDVDVIMITAANDMESLNQALHLGIIDYLVKPFQYERFEWAMNKYLLRKTLMKTGMKFNQNDIDQLLSLQKLSSKSKEMEFQKGIQRKTLESIRCCLKQYENQYLTSEQIAIETGFSKVTIRRYMNYLIEQNEAISRIDYSTGGRPCVEYCTICK